MFSGFFFYFFTLKYNDNVERFKINKASENPSFVLTKPNITRSLKTNQWKLGCLVFAATQGQGLHKTFFNVQRGITETYGTNE